MVGLCMKGQFYETATDRCLSCKIPCSLNKDVCKAMGCIDFVENGQQPTTTIEVLVIDSRDNRTLEYAGFSPVEEDALIIVATVTVVVIGIGIVFLYIILKIKRRRNQYSKPEDSETTRTDKMINNAPPSCGVYIEMERRASGSLIDQLLPSDIPRCKSNEAIQQETQPQGDVGDTRGYYGSVYKSIDPPNTPSNTGQTFREYAIV